MIGSAMIIHADDRGPEVMPCPKPPTLAFMQKAVGGYLELVPYFNTMQLDAEGTVAVCRVFCNEDGKGQGLPVNRVATRMWHDALTRLEDGDGNQLYPRGLRGPDGAISDMLVGSVLILIGDDAFMKAL